MQTEQTYIRPLNLSDLLDGVFRIYRHRFLTFIGAAALILIPFAVFQLILVFGIQDRLLSGLSDPSSFAMNPLAMLGSGNFIASVILGLFQNVIAIPAMYGALVWAAAQTAQQRSISMLGAYDYGAGRMLALIGASILVMLITLLVIGVPFGLIIGFGFFAATATTGGEPGVASAGFILLLFLFLLVGIIAILFLTIKLIFIPQAVVLEGRGASAAFYRSWDLTSGSFWRVFGILLIVFLMTFVLSFIVSLIWQAVVMVIIINDSFSVGSMAASQAVNLLIETLLDIIIYPIYGIATTLLYFDLRTRREGYDLQLMTENMARSFETRL